MRAARLALGTLRSLVWVGVPVTVLAACSGSASEGRATTGGGSAGTGSAGAGGQSGTCGAATDGAAGEGSGGEPSYAQLGVCGRRGAATVDATSFEGYEEFYLIGDEGFGDDVCVVRFDVERVGEAPGGCDTAAGQQDECLWTHQVRYSGARVEVDVEGACADSELKLGPHELEAIAGSETAYGFVSEYQGHSSVLMEYVGTGWQPAGNAVWDEQSSAFRFDRREGYCGYSSTSD